MKNAQENVENMPKSWFTRTCPSFQKVLTTRDPNMKLQYTHTHAHSVRISKKCLGEPSWRRKKRIARNIKFISLCHILDDKQTRWCAWAIRKRNLLNWIHSTRRQRLTHSSHILETNLNKACMCFFWGVLFRLFIRSVCGECPAIRLFLIHVFVMSSGRIKLFISRWVLSNAFSKESTQIDNPTRILLLVRYKWSIKRLVIEFGIFVFSYPKSKQNAVVGG